MKFSGVTGQGELELDYPPLMSWHILPMPGEIPALGRGSGRAELSLRALGELSTTSQG